MKGTAQAEKLDAQASSAANSEASKAKVTENFQKVSQDQKRGSAMFEKKGTGALKSNLGKQLAAMPPPPPPP